MEGSIITTVTGLRVGGTEISWFDILQSFRDFSLLDFHIGSRDTPSLLSVVDQIQSDAGV